MFQGEVLHIHRHAGQHEIHDPLDAECAQLRSYDSQFRPGGIHKAVYLAYLLYKDGLRVEDTFGEFREITKKIYGHLPFADKNEKLTGGIRDAEGTTFDAYTKTLRGYFTNIRDAISDKVADPLVAQDFAIEGFKGAPFGIAKTTPEIIAQIKEDFML